ncbi:MAG: NB-ARC domain-containing protein [Leptolyngbyaceae cyanobacterium bins.59]|nr:NB-ARC domain-containing protein [Leptolyngbyaceae cyanobacterium bins.59]
MIEVEQGLEIADEIVFVKTGRRLSSVEIAVLQGAWLSQTYEQIADSTNYSISYLNRTVAPKLWQTLSLALGEEVNKKNFRFCMERRWRQDQKNAAIAQSFNAVAEAPQLPVPNPQFLPPTAQPGNAKLCASMEVRVDWGDAIDVSVFYGRDQELTTLRHWIVDDRCRLVVILGMGGMGKTALSIRLAQQVMGTGEVSPPPFQFIIWRSLGNAPLLEDLVRDLIPVLSDGQDRELPKSTSAQISRLLYYFKQRPCLLILDGIEAILRSGNPVGQYLPDYEAYRDLMRQVGEGTHQSCVMITSREKPMEIAALEGETLPVRVLQLAGLDLAESMEVFATKGLSGSDDDRQQLLDRYRGNPLALKIVSTSIRELFDGNITQFLQEETIIFNGIRILLDQQFNRLADLEKQILYWLTINREWVSLSGLQNDLVPATPRPKLLETLEYLGRRSLIDQSAAQFTLQPVMMEYLTEKLIEQVTQELIEATTGSTDTFANAMFHRYALIKATAKDFVRENQIRLILQPIVDRLRLQFSSEAALEQQILRILMLVRRAETRLSGYGPGNLLNLMARLGLDFTGYDFSQLTVRQAYLRDVFLRRVNFANANLSQSIFAEPIGSIQTARFSADGTLIAAAGVDGFIYVWRTDTGQRLYTLPAHTHYITDLTFSPIAPLLASSSLDATVKIWDLETGRCVQTWQTPSSSWGVVFSSKGEWLVNGQGDGSIRIWEVKTGHCLKVLEGHVGQVRDVAIHPTGEMLASGGYDHTVRLWNLTTGDCLTVLTGHTHVIWQVAFNPQGTQLATASFDRTLKLWDIREMQPSPSQATSVSCTHTLELHTKQVTGIAYSPIQAGEPMLISLSFDRTVRIWNPETGDCLHLISGYRSNPWSVDLSPDGQLILTGSEDGIRLRDVSNGASVLTLQGVTQAVRGLAFHAHSGQWVSSGDDCQVRIWDGTGHCVPLSQSHPAPVWGVTCHPQAPLIASGCLEGQIKLWDSATGRCLQTIQAHADWILGLATHPQGNWFVSGSFDCTLKFWNWNGECLRSVSTEHNIYPIAVHPQGDRIATGSNDYQVRLWDGETGSCLLTLQGHTNIVWAVAFHPNGKVLVSGGDDQTIRVWDGKSGQCLVTLQEHQGAVLSLAFNAEGTYLASSGSDRSIRIWDTKTWKCLKVLEGHTSVVPAIVFQPTDGKQVILVSASQDETIRIWDGETGVCLQVFRPERIYEGMKIAQVNGLTEAQKAALQLLGASLD